MPNPQVQEHAHAFRLRIDAEGTSAGEVENLFRTITAKIVTGTEIRMHVAAQVIELGDPPSPGATWFKGRLVLAPELNDQGCDFANGDVHWLGVGEPSIPAVYADRVGDNG